MLGAPGEPAGECLQPYKHGFIKFQRPAAGAKPSDSPHPFMGAGRDGIVAESAESSELDGPPPRRRPLPKIDPKFKENSSPQKVTFFLKNGAPRDPNWTPKSSKFRKILQKLLPKTPSKMKTEKRSKKEALPTPPGP